MGLQQFVKKHEAQTVAPVVEAKTTAVTEVKPIVAEMPKETATQPLLPIDTAEKVAPKEFFELVSLRDDLNDLGWGMPQVYAYGVKLKKTHKMDVGCCLSSMARTTFGRVYNSTKFFNPPNKKTGEIYPVIRMNKLKSMVLLCQLALAKAKTPVPVRPSKKSKGVATPTQQNGDLTVTMSLNVSNGTANSTTVKAKQVRPVKAKRVRSGGGVLDPKQHKCYPQMKKIGEMVANLQVLFGNKCPKCEIFDRANNKIIAGHSTLKSSCLKRILSGTGFIKKKDGSYKCVSGMRGLNKALDLLILVYKDPVIRYRKHYRS